MTLNKGEKNVQKRRNDPRGVFINPLSIRSFDGEYHAGWWVVNIDTGISHAWVPLVLEAKSPKYAILSDDGLEFDVTINRRCSHQSLPEIVPKLEVQMTRPIHTTCVRQPEYSGS